MGGGIGEKGLFDAWVVIDKSLLEALTQLRIELEAKEWKQFMKENRYSFKKMERKLEERLNE